MSDLIDRQAVIDLLKQMRKDGNMVPWEGKDVFARIRKLPTIQPEKEQLSCGGTTSDTISRQAAIDEVMKYGTIWMEYTDAMSKDEIAQIALNNAKSTMIRILKEQPTVQPERKKGRWLPDNNSMYEMRFICSECKESEVVPTIGFTKYKPIWDYCPNCGADMRGGQNG